MSDPTTSADVLDSLREVNLSEWLNLSGWRGPALAVVAGGLILLWLSRRLGKFIRSSRPVRFSEKLQPYAEGVAPLDESVVAQRRSEALKIVATSSKDNIVGYEIVEQVEAVYVDGFRRPEDALEGLKAAAAMKGANAVINLRHERSASVKFAASGDAVMVKKTVSRAGGQQRENDNKTSDSDRQPHESL